MVVINWIKNTLDSGHKLVLRSFKSSVGSIFQQKKQVISEQRALSEHFQKCTLGFIEKLESLTDKISTLENGNKQTISYIKQRQQDLFFACLRMETALKTDADLRRERKEWERRLPAMGPLDAYHPLVRLELIESELRIRERKLVPKISNVAEVSPVESLTLISDAGNIGEAVLVEESPGRVTVSHGFESGNELSPLPADLILRRAEGLLKEIALEQDNCGNKDEYLEKTQELRDIHNTLRQLQRKNRHQSYRLRLRERMSQLFS